MDEENEKSAQNSNDTDYETDEEALGNNFQHIRNHSKRPNSVTEILDFIIILNLTFSEKIISSSRHDSRHYSGGSVQHQVHRVLLHRHQHREAPCGNWQSSIHWRIPGNKVNSNF